MKHELQSYLDEFPRNRMDKAALVVHGYSKDLWNKVRRVCDEKSCVVAEPTFNPSSAHLPARENRRLAESGGEYATQLAGLLRRVLKHPPTNGRHSRTCDDFLASLCVSVRLSCDVTPSLPQVSVDGEMIKVALLFTDQLSLADLKVSARHLPVLCKFYRVSLPAKGPKSHCCAHDRPAQRGRSRGGTFLREKSCSLIQRGPD